jgi:very-short-patch-repair endonuclease
MRHKTEKSQKLRQQNLARNSCQWSLANKNYLAQSETKRQTMLVPSPIMGAAQ